jgi:amicyanin
MNWALWGCLGGGIAAAGLVLVVAGCSQSKPVAVVGGAAGGHETVKVSIDNFSYSPAEVLVAAGSTVVWTNRDDVPHTVTASDKQFNSPALDTDETFSRRFDQAGTYEYFCAVHPHMTGRIVVK